MEKSKTFAIIRGGGIRYHFSCDRGWLVLGGTGSEQGGTGCQHDELSENIWFACITDFYRRGRVKNKQRKCINISYFSSFFVRR